MASRISSPCTRPLWPSKKGSCSSRLPASTATAASASGLDAAALERLAGNESLRLFVDRATAVKPGFALTLDNAPAVLEICRRLDGIALAIELAATRVRVMTVEQIATRLAQRFRLLTGGSRTALPHQQTLAAALDWSHDLLDPREQRLFRRLSVFSGGWTVEAVEAPRIDGATTIGVHRVVQTEVEGKPRTGEVFNYSAHFGDYQVIVAANPLVLPDKPTVPVDTQRARDLLIAGVNAIR